MYGGRVLERAPVDDLFARPQSPYTAGLLRAMPRLDQVRERLVAIDGAPPDLRDPPKGCPFEPRCLAADGACLETPELQQTTPDRHVACWHPLADTTLEPTISSGEEISLG
jgi:oligopeptide/dipeptide ABC transporter ATP-binding protein